MATDFFERQDHARRQTVRLLLLFVFAVAAIIGSVYLVATLILVAAQQNRSRNTDRDQAVRGPTVAVPLLEGERLTGVATAVLAIIASGSVYKVFSLHDGGDAVARMLGGRLLNPTSGDLSEQRLLHVVEEMALASGTPVPPVYLLDHEPSINAIAAGFTPGDAVIGVSRGALEHLNRDELQGVIGHEFSHILNGDMRLNLRLIGLVHGILVIALLGMLLIRLVLEGFGRRNSSSSDSDKATFSIVALMLVTGAALYSIGWIGVFFGRVIKAAISRQREFLADASSVQFTRNPAGIIGALKKIGGLEAGSLIKSPNAEQASHMFFGQGVWTLTSLLATHPPLDERIRRLDPSFTGAFAVEAPDEESATDALQVGFRSGVSALSPAAPMSLETDEAIATIGSPSQAHVDYAAALIAELPPAVSAAAREPFSARAVVFALLLDQEPAIRQRQLDYLETEAERGTAAEVIRLAPLVQALGKPARIPLADLTFPALRRLSAAQYTSFRQGIDALVRADARVVLFEYTLQRMLLRHLDRAFNHVGPARIRFQTLDPVFADADLLISTLARLGHRGQVDTGTAYSLAMQRLQAAYPGERQVAIQPQDRCSLGAVDRALERLAQAGPEVKRRVLEACAECIACDGILTLPEAELLRAVADSLDCPMPPLLPRQESGSRG